MIYSIFNDLADIAIKLTMDHLLYADDVNLTTPRKQALFALGPICRGLRVNFQPF